MPGVKSLSNVPSRLVCIIESERFAPACVARRDPGGLNSEGGFVADYCRSVVGFGVTLFPPKTAAGTPYLF